MVLCDQCWHEYAVNRVVARHPPTMNHTNKRGRSRSNRKKRSSVVQSSICFKAGRERVCVCVCVRAQNEVCSTIGSIRLCAFFPLFPTFQELKCAPRDRHCKRLAKGVDPIDLLVGPLFAEH